MLFICRQCILRLSQSPPKQLKPKSSRLHTSVVPIPGSDPSELGTQQAFPTDSTEPPTDSSLGPSRLPWNGTVKKFVVKERKEIESIGGQPQVTTAYTLKKKILESLGDYRFIHGDLMNIYGLSHPEARYAIHQLERLLWGYGSGKQGVRMDEYHLWKRDFAGILHKVDGSSAPTGESPEETASSIWISLDKQDPAALQISWERLDRERRQRVWPQMILSAMASNPGILPTFIHMTFDPSWCPNYVIEDVLYFLFRVADTLEDSDDRRKEVSELALSVVNNCPPRYLNLGQPLLQIIVASKSNSELLEFYQHLRNIEHRIHPNTLLHFASRLAKSSAHKLDAVQIIRTLTKIPGFDLNTPAAASVCTSLLTVDENSPLPQDDAAPDELFRVLLEHGFRPNLLGLTALMRNFSVRGHLDTAWSIFELIIKHGFEPDHYVFSILLNGAKRHQDMPAMQRMIHIIRARNAWSAFLVNDCLDIIFRQYEAQPEQRRRQRKKASHAWPPMLQFYAKFYDMSLLQKFTRFPLENLLVSADSSPPKYSTYITEAIAALIPRPDVLLMKPESDTLILMIAAHMRSINGPKHLKRYFQKFSRMLQEDDADAVNLVKNHKTLIHDIFIRAFMQFKQTIEFSLNIVEDMVRKATRERRMLGRNIRYHPPSIYTWTILLNGFKNHNSTDGATTVLDMMVGRGGVEPNIITWNALIRAFSRKGDVRGAVRAMRCLEDAGFKSNDRTVEAFPKRLRDYGIQLLEASRQKTAAIRESGGYVSEPHVLVRWSRRASESNRYANPRAWQPALRPARPAVSPLARPLEALFRAQDDWARVLEREHRQQKRAADAAA